MKHRTSSSEIHVHYGSSLSHQQRDRQIISKLGDNDFFGERSVLAAWKRGESSEMATATCECASYCDMLTLSVEHFGHALRKNGITLDAGENTMKKLVYERDLKKPNRANTRNSMLSESEQAKMLNEGSGGKKGEDSGSHPFRTRRLSSGAGMDADASAQKSIGFKVLSNCSAVAALATRRRSLQGAKAPLQPAPPVPSTAPQPENRARGTKSGGATRTAPVLSA